MMVVHIAISAAVERSFGKSRKVSFTNAATPSDAEKPGDLEMRLSLSYIPVQFLFISIPSVPGVSIGENL